MTQRFVHGLDQEWFVGSNHGTDEQPDYQYNLDGWPFFVGIKETRRGKYDYHIATGIQDRELALDIAHNHNETIKPA